MKNRCAIFNIGDIYEEDFTVSDEIYTGFIHVFRDTNPLHTNQSFAVDKGFDGIVMHGNILNGFLSYFIGERLPAKDVIIHTQEIRFKNPVYLNNTLRFKARVAGIHESVNAVEFKFEFRNQVLKTVAKGNFQIGIL
jgi:3-hydroxybutyryl-CoA dehydratase